MEAKANNIVLKTENRKIERREDVLKSAFFKIKDGKRFILNFNSLVLSFFLHLKYLEQYKSLKQKRIYLMKLVIKNNQIINELLDELYLKLPIKIKDLDLIKVSEKKEKQVAKKEEKEEIKKEISELERLKKEVEELELQILRLINEK